MDYRLSLKFDAAALEAIYAAGEQVTLARRAGEGAVPLVWIAFTPYIVNAVSWQDSYMLYASHARVQPGAIVHLDALTAAEPGWTYAFAHEAFSGAAGGARDAFTVRNELEEPLAFGLAQQATVNGDPITAARDLMHVAEGRSATFRPHEELSIFLSRNMRSGSVLERIPGNALTVALSTSFSHAEVGFDASLGVFYLRHASLGNVAFAG
ncbi:MAG: hypothetical protein M3Q69_03370 [Acidobacteriota bacterium]|nr:hypothetical protein [Acidobacteriota bacterium]